MATKKKTSPALIAAAINVIATIDRRCRAGYIFTNEKEKRIELDKLTPEHITAIETDPYLKVTYEADEELADGGLADNRILELENTLSEKEAELANANERLSNLEMAIEAKQGGIDELKAQLEAKDAEIAELKAAATTKAKK